MVWGHKIAFDWVDLLKNLVMMKLGAVVKRDGLEALAMLGNGVDRRLVDLSHRAARQLLDDGQARFALHQCQHAMALVRAHHRVTFPVANALPGFNLFGPFADVPLPRQNAPVIDALVALACELRDDPRVPPQRASQLAITQDVALDRAVADLHLVPHPQHSSDLLRAPLLAQQRVDVAPVVGLEQGPSSASPSPTLRVLLRLRRSVCAVVPGGISRHLSADRRGTPPHLQRDASHTRATAQSRGNEVSFLSGELVIRQGCNPCLAGKRKQQ